MAAYAPPLQGALSLFERMEPTALLALSAFCQRVLNSGDNDVKEGLKLSKFLDLSALLAPLHCEADATYAFVAEMLEEVIRALTPVAADETGFRVLCEEAQVLTLRSSPSRRMLRLQMRRGQGWPR